MKHNPRITNPTPVVGSRSKLRKAQMEASMSPKKNEAPQTGKNGWLQGMTVEMMLGRSKRY